MGRRNDIITGIRNSEVKTDTIISNVIDCAWTNIEEAAESIKKCSFAIANSSIKRSYSFNTAHQLPF